MKPPFLILILILILFIFPLLSTAATGQKYQLGGWRPIEEINGAHVKEMAQFAVAKYNKSSEASLEFQILLKAESQTVSEINYRLVIAERDGNSVKKYEAVVRKEPWEHLTKLTSFKVV